MRGKVWIHTHKKNNCSFCLKGKFKAFLLLSRYEEKNDSSLPQPLSVALKLEEGEEEGERNETEPAGVTEEPGEKYSQVLTSVPKIKAKFFLTFQIFQGRKYGKLLLGSSPVSLRNSELSMPRGPLAQVLAQLVQVPFFALVVCRERYSSPHRAVYHLLRCGCSWCHLPPQQSPLTQCRAWALQVGIAFYLCWLSREKISSCWAAVR